jgi:hypothetical protein
MIPPRDANVDPQASCGICGAVLHWGRGTQLAFIPCKLLHVRLMAAHAA